jgi:CheY-like chemotaxis protein
LRGKHRENMNSFTTFNESARAEIPSGSDSGSAPLPRSLRILLVDDEPSIRDHLKGYLVMKGNSVETAVDGVHGLERFATGTWDLVLADYKMPRMNGLELALAVKERSPETPVILISGVPGLAVRGQESKLPIDGFVPKPFTEDHLREALAKVVRKSS